MFEIDPISFSLSNGLKVVFTKREAFVAHMGVMIRAGSRFETKEEEGLAHFVEHTIFKGTKNRAAYDIFSRLDSVGGELNAYTNKEELCLHASFRKMHFSIASELLSDLIMNPTFPEKEIKRERGVVLDEINSYLDSPVDRIHDEFEERLFKGHSLGYNILGRKATLKSFDRDTLLAFVEKMFTADNMVISVVGNFEVDEVRDQLEEDFKFVRKTKIVHDIIKFDEQVKPFHKRFHKSNYQSHILIGGLTPSYTKLDRRALTLLTNVLGGPALNARLVLSIREKHGYAYNVEANFTPYAEVGFWTIYAGTDKKYCDKTIKLIRQELEDIHDNGIGEQEFEEGKEQLKGHIALSMDSNLELMFYLAKNVLLYNKVDTIQEIYQQIDEVTIDDVKNVGRSTFENSIISDLVYEF